MCGSDQPAIGLGVALWGHHRRWVFTGDSFQQGTCRALARHNHGAIRAAGHGMRFVVQTQTVFGCLATMARVAMLLEQWPDLFVEVHGLAVGEYGKTE